MKSATAAAAALCVAIILLLSVLQQQYCWFLLLFVIVYWTAKFIAGSLNRITVFSFSFKRAFNFPHFIWYPFAVLQLCRIYGLELPYYIVGNYGHARSQGGRQPATAKPSLHYGIISQLTFLRRLYCRVM